MSHRVSKEYTYISVTVKNPTLYQNKRDISEFVISEWPWRIVRYLSLQEVEKTNLLCKKSSQSLHVSGVLESGVIAHQK